MRAFVGFVVSVVSLLTLTFTGAALAAGEVTLYEAGLREPEPAGIAADSGGSLWFTEDGVNGAAGLGSITTSGVLTEHHLGLQSPTGGITAGPENLLWFTVPGLKNIGRIEATSSAKAQYTEVKGGAPWQIAESKSAGGTPDGNLWFTIHGASTHEIGYINAKTLAVEEVELEAPGQPEDIVGGPEGDLWVTVPTSHAIVRVNPANPKEQRSFGTEGLEPSGIAASSAGPNGELWFTVKNADEIGRLLPNKAEAREPRFTEVGGKAANTNGIAVGPEGDVWFTYNKLDQIGRLTTEAFAGGELQVGSFRSWTIPAVSQTASEKTEYEEANEAERQRKAKNAREEEEHRAEYGAGAITAGPGGEAQMWFTLPARGTARGRIGRIGTAELAPPTEEKLSVTVLGGATERIEAGAASEEWFIGEEGASQTFTAEVHGSRRPGAAYYYSWDEAGDNIPLEPITSGPSLTYTPPPGSASGVSKHFYVRVEERLPGQETRQAVRAFNVRVAKERPTCRHRLEFALTLVTVSNGCLVANSAGEYETAEAARVNGILLTPPAGAKLRFLANPTTGGSMTVQTTIHVGPLELPIKGTVSFPAGTSGEGRVAELSSSGKLAGLALKGNVTMSFGYEHGVHYSSFKLTVELPEVFKKTLGGGGVSGEGSVKVEASSYGGASTVRFNGLKVEAQEAWIGKLEIKSACFAYLPAGSDVSSCGSAGGKSLECNENANANRWTGSASVVLPTPKALEISAFGALEEGRLANLGGSVSGLNLPIFEGVNLERVGIGLCLKPPPLKARGEVGVKVLGDVDITGEVEYVEAYGGAPWHVKLGGSVEAFGRELGHGYVVINAAQEVEFLVNVGTTFNGKIFGKTVELGSIEGLFNGWVQLSSARFNLEGHVTGCIHGLGCAGAEALINNHAIAGCAHLGELSGFIAYRWRAKEAEIGLGCDLSPYVEAKASAARASAQAGGARTVLVSPGTREIAFRVHGTSGPPRVSVTGPDGTRILPPSAGEAERSAHSLVLESAVSGTTIVLVNAPAAGAWHIEATAENPLTGLEVAHYQPPPRVSGTVRSTGATRTVELTYTAPAGSEISLVERGREVNHEVSTSVKGGRCAKAPAPVPGERSRCAKLTFAPVPARSAARKLVAVVSRDGIPQRAITVASFKGVLPAPPPTPAALQLRRKGTSLTLAWRVGSSPKAYAVLVNLSNGRELGYTVKGGCRALRILAVGRKLTAKVRITAVRARDLQLGRTVRTTIKGSSAHSGASYRLPGKVCG